MAFNDLEEVEGENTATEDRRTMNGVPKISSGHAEVYPIIPKGPNVNFITFATMNLEGLLLRLPCLEDGAGRETSGYERY